MDIDARREELREHIGRAYNAMRLSEVVPLIPNAEHRARIIAKAGELFGIPDKNDTGDKIFSATLIACRLKEDSLGSKEERELKRGHMVGLLIESALMSEAQAKGVSYGVTDSVAAEEAKNETPADPFTAGMDARPVAVPEPAPETPPMRRPAIGSADLTGVQLFETDDPIRPLPPANFVSLLQPGPGPKADGRLLSRWISGIPAHPGEWAIGPRRLDATGADAFSEIETDLLAAPEQYLARHGQDQVLSPDAPMPGGAQPTDIMSRVMAACPDNGLEADAVRLFRQALGVVISEYWPERAADLTASGATLTIGSELAKMMGAALATERQWLEELDGDSDGPRQIVMGDVNPQGRIEEGLLFRRMAFLGYGCAMNATAALAEAMIGLRFSLLHRHIDRTAQGEPCGNFDKLFFDDCTRPVEDYVYMEPEPAPAI